MMQPFTVSNPAQQLKLGFLRPSEFIAASRQFGLSEIGGLLRHWLMEGTPFAFSHTPMLYEIIRAWLSRQLGIDPMEVKLIGSARTGFSLAPPPDFGRAFNATSDLDFAVVSAQLYSKCKDAFEQWKTDYQSNIVSPRNSREQMYWDENLTVVANSIENGFVDPNKIPTLDRYPILQTIANAMWLLKSKLDISEQGITVRKASVRVYENSATFYRQVKRNFGQSTLAANGA